MAAPNERPAGLGDMPQTVMLKIADFVPDPKILMLCTCLNKAWKAALTTPPAEAGAYSSVYKRLLAVQGAFLERWRQHHASVFVSVTPPPDRPEPFRIDDLVTIAGDPQPNIRPIKLVSVIDECYFAQPTPPSLLGAISDDPYNVPACSHRVYRVMQGSRQLRPALPWHTRVDAEEDVGEDEDGYEWFYEPRRKPFTVPVRCIVCGESAVLPDIALALQEPSSAPGSNG